MTPNEIAWFEHALGYVSDFMMRFQTGLSPRERLIASISLHAAHAEEAIAAGDSARAHAHIAGMGEELRKLNGS